jgi:uncharacterized protein YndB with AHSA1/START domain
VSAAPDLSAMVARVEIRFPAPVRTVWDLLTDLPRMATWSPEVASLRWLTAGGCREGARFEARNRRGTMGWQVTGEITVVRPYSCFGWVVGDVARPSSTWTYELRDEGDATGVTQRFEHGPGRSWVRHLLETDPGSASVLVEHRRRMLESDMRATLSGAASALAS